MRLDGTVRIADLARECGLSMSHFIQAFKRAIGMTPHRRLAERRIKKAKALPQTNAPLSHVALACGFASQSHFTRVFTELVGAPPGQWRRHLAP